MAVRCSESDDDIRKIDESESLLSYKKPDSQPKLPDRDEESEGNTGDDTNEANKIEEKLNQFNEMRVLIVGKSGVGKSSFLNTLYGEDKAEIGRVKPTTDKVTPYTLIDRRESGVKVIVFDTPGFGTNDKENKKTIKEIRKECELVDVIFLCIRMDDQLRAEDERTITLLAKKFGDDFWKKMVIVFTRANMVKPMGQHRVHSLKEYLQSVRDELEIVVAETLRKAKITEPPLIVIAGAPEFSTELRMIPNIEDKSSADSQIDWLPVVEENLIFNSGCTENGKAVLLKSGWGKWARASAGSGVGSAVGVVAGTCIVVAGITALPVPPVGIAVAAVGGAVILLSLAAGGTGTAACGTTAAVKKIKKERKIEKVLSAMSKGTDSDQ